MSALLRRPAESTAEGRDRSLVPPVRGAPAGTVLGHPGLPRGSKGAAHLGLAGRVPRDKRLTQVRAPVGAHLADGERPLSRARGERLLGAEAKQQHGVEARAHHWAKLTQLRAEPSRQTASAGALQPVPAASRPRLARSQQPWSALKLADRGREVWPEASGRPPAGYSLLLLRVDEAGQAQHEERRARGAERRRRASGRPAEEAGAQVHQRRPRGSP
mmetsp:Transcript_46420/g.150767  ORF Transcript_46420/g.150767 Transcript_46420/m.150767 type:complete len:217 (-) Transcript_46420:31-681(-)